jgi:hypothetical protein
MYLFDISNILANETWQISVTSGGAECVRYPDGVRPGKVAYFSGCEARPGRLASHRVASPWIDGSNP